MLAEAAEAAVATEARRALPVEVAARRDVVRVRWEGVRWGVAEDAARADERHRSRKRTGAGWWGTGG